MDLDPVFQAMADPQRRMILDLLKAQPGMTLMELCEHFSVTRFAVMKHLRVLERATLVITRREGRYRRLYLNAVPIQMIVDRWMSSFSQLWAPRLTRLKYGLESEEIPM